MSLNRWIGIGRLTKQPELRITPGGTSVTTVTLAVDRPPRDGNKEVDFIEVVMFGKLAENVCKYQDKGSLVAVEGRIQTRSYDTKDGQKRKVFEIVAENAQFLSPKKREDNAEEVFVDE